MNTLLQLASAALAANDAEQLEALCQRAAALPSLATADEQVQASLSSLRKQLASARQNVVLRERLLAMRSGEVVSWVR